MKSKYLKAFRLSTTLRPMILSQKRKIQNCLDDSQIPNLVSRLDTLLKRQEIINTKLKM